MVGDIEALGFPENEVRIQGEPLDFGVSGIMSIPRIDFEVALTRELIRIGATKVEAESFVAGVKHGGSLVFATGPDQLKVDAAAEVMNKHGAVQIEEVAGEEPNLPAGAGSGSMKPIGERSVQAGRVNYPSGGGGARGFVW